MPTSDRFKAAGFARQKVTPAFVQPLQFQVVSQAIAAAAEPAIVATAPENAPVASARPAFVATAVRKNELAIPLQQEAVFSNLAEAKFINPALGIDIAAVVPPTNGVPREQITVPISQVADISDERLFESPGEPGKHYYLPRYSIQHETVSGQERIRAALQQEGDGGSLTIALEPYAADAIAEASRSAIVLPHAVSVLLRYSLGGSQQELEFLEKTDTLDQVVLRLNSLDLYRRVFRAVSSGETSGTQLVIRRLIRVAIPVPLPPRPPKRPPGHFPPDDDIPFDLPPALRKRLLLKRNTSRPFVPMVAFQDEPPQVPLYRETDRASDVSPVGIDWPELLFGYVYKSPAPPAPIGNDNDLIVRSVEFEGRAYRYFQDAAQREVFYCLPDSFKLARQPNSPYYPFISVRFTSADGSLNNTQVQMTYVAVPFVNAARIKAAIARFGEFVPENKSKDITLQPLASTNLTFRLAVPGTGSSAGPFQQREGVSIDLRSALRDQLTLSINEFQLIYNALATPNSLLFQGEILVKVQDETEEVLPLVSRLNDLAGDVFDYKSVPDATTGVVAVTLSNAIESPVSISRLTASLFYDDAEVPAVLNQFAAPVEIKPEESISFEVAPGSAADVRPGVLPRVAFNMETDVRPNLAAVWEAIVDPFTVAEFQKKVVIKTFRELFDDGDKPGIAAILVDVEGSETVELSNDVLSAATLAQLPLRDVVLNTPGSGKFRFRVSTVRASGSETGEWQTATGSTTLFITKNLLP